MSISCQFIEIAVKPSAYCQTTCFVFSILAINLLQAMVCSYVQLQKTETPKYQILDAWICRIYEPQMLSIKIILINVNHALKQQLYLMGKGNIGLTKNSLKITSIIRQGLTHCITSLKTSTKICNLKGNDPSLSPHKFLPCQFEG